MPLKKGTVCKTSTITTNQGSQVSPVQATAPPTAGHHQVCQESPGKLMCRSVAKQIRWINGVSLSVSKMSGPGRGS